MNPVVFIHVAMIGRWREVLAELVGELSASGLYDRAENLVCSFVGSPADDIDKLIHSADLPEKYLRMNSGYLDDFEFPTLEGVWNLANTAEIAQQETRAVLYIHTKGVSSDRVSHRSAWRRFMTYHVIGHWRKCVYHLRDVEVVGVQRREKANWYLDHFAGNFWWSTTKYLASLESPHKFNSPQWKSNRHGAEMWVCSGKPKIMNLASVDWKYIDYPMIIHEEFYRGQDDA